MKISIVVIAYNEEKNILYCIQSIVKQNGLGKDYEIIVVDDGSTDNTVKIVNECIKDNSKIRLISDGKNYGRGHARYVGINATSGDMIAMVDGDIILPNVWMKTCLKYINEYSAVGGVPIPDGDVAYVYNRFNLRAKTVLTTAAVTGSNGLYKRVIFDSLQFNPNLREGEDFDFNRKMSRQGFKTSSISTLQVNHHEDITLVGSIRWFYQIGIGATRQFISYKEVRMPDLAFFGFIVVLAATCVSYAYIGVAAILFIIVYSLVVSSAHMARKFYLSNNYANSIQATIVDAILLLSYYLGRIVGLVKIRTSLAQLKGDK